MLGTLTSIISAGWRLYRGETTLEDMVTSAVRDRIDQRSSPVTRAPDSVRCEHLLAVGQSGCGKSSFLYDLMCRDIALARKHKRTMIYIDPVNGVDKLVDETGIGGWRNVFLIDPADPDSLPRLNLFETGHRRSSILGTTHMINTFKSVCSGLIGQELTPTMTTLFGYCSRVMIRVPDRTLRDLMDLLHDPLGYLEDAGFDSDDDVFRFFAEDVVGGGRSKGSFSDTAKYVRNRIHGFLNDPIIERLLINRHPTMSLAKVIESGSVLLIATRKSDVGEDGARLIGRFIKAIVNRIVQERSHRPEGSGVPIFFYEDEFHNSLSGGSDGVLETMLDENRKFGLSVNLATTRLGRLNTSMVDAVLTCTGTKVCGTLQSSGAAIMSRVMGRSSIEISELPRYRLFVKCGSGSKSATMIMTKKDPFRALARSCGGRSGMADLRASMRRRFGSDYVACIEASRDDEASITDVEVS